MVIVCISHDDTNEDIFKAVTNTLKNVSPPDGFTEFTLMSGRSASSVDCGGWWDTVSFVIVDDGREGESRFLRDAKGMARRQRKRKRLKSECAWNTLSLSQFEVLILHGVVGGAMVVDRDIIDAIGRGGKWTADGFEYDFEVSWLPSLSKRRVGLGDGLFKSLLFNIIGNNDIGGTCRSLIEAGNGCITNDMNADYIIIADATCEEATAARRLRKDEDMVNRTVGERHSLITSPMWLFECITSFEIRVADDDDI
eukprot:GHVO01022612.1.p1 GENE.GHVO01022612.1~~GHVO01022612.1.p1  ORF type:complete len:291 (+),score=72.95 GHVO01022612.1:114-875(+)